MNNRVNLNIVATKEEVDSLSLIINKVNCASQAAQIGAIPDGATEEKVKWFIQAAIDSLSNYQWLQKDWWNSMMSKYNLPKDNNVWVDFQTYDFYIIKD